MSQAFVTVPHVARPRARTWLDRMVGFVTAAVSRLVAEWHIHTAAQQISALDDRGLADIGLGHGQAEGAARYGRSRTAQAVAAWRAPERSLMPQSFTEWR